MVRLLPLLSLMVLAAACAGARPSPTPSPTATPETAPEARDAAPAVAQPAEDDPYALLTPCLADVPAGERTPAALQAVMEAAFERRDPRCHAAAEIALGLRLLEARDLRSGALHLRQAELRANRHALDDLAAVALLARARVALAAGEPEPALSLLERAAQAADLHTLTTGEAPPALDAIHLKRAVESLAQWERTGDPSWFEEALGSVQRLQGREALRAFAAEGAGPDALLEAAGLPEAAARRRALAEVSAALRQAWGPEVRRRAPERLQLAELMLEATPVWVAQAPQLLDWLPGEVPGLLTTVQSTLAEGEALVVLAVGPAHGLRMVVGPRTLSARPLPGRAALERAGEACAAGDCASLADLLLADVGRGRTQLLLSAQGPIHALPLEAAAPAGVRVARTPSPLGTAGLRLRAWDGKPAVLTRAADLVGPGHQAEPLPEAAAAPDDPTIPDAPAAPSPPADAPEPAPPESPAGPALVPDHAVTAPEGPEALAALRAALSAGARLVAWRTGPEAPPRIFGAPLTVPVPDEEGNVSETEAGSGQTPGSAPH